MIKAILVGNGLSCIIMKLAWGSLAKFSRVAKNVVLMQEILRTGSSRSINAACSGMLVQGGFIPRFCGNKFLACLSYISLLLKRIIMDTQGRFLWK